MPLPSGNELSPNPQSTSSDGYASIYSFGQGGKANDGAFPSSNLIEVDGVLYGTTQYGGTTNAYCYLGCGTVFKITASGKERVIYRFEGNADGASPVAGLVAIGGKLYGTTSAGGAASACGGGCGTVFVVSTNGKSEKVLHAFTGAPDGAEPVAGLARTSGEFYGTTQFGGNVTELCVLGCGTVFKIDASGAESPIHRFKGGADGTYPTGGLLELNGDLYGTTEYGGATTRFCATGCGTIFRMGDSGAKKTLHAFTYGRASDGANPQASLIAMNGKLYGTTTGGGKYGNGAVFAASASSGTDKLLYSFQCCQVVKYGSFPLAALTMVKGKLYGTTRNGGKSNNGTVFVVTTAGVETMLYQFTGKPDGESPQAGLTLAGGTLYGTTADGGSASLGTVFKIAP
jgi:uncharacterized repeat protein (TIGR03803 family)